MAEGQICLILGSGFLSHPVYGVNPDAVAAAGVAVRLRASVGPKALAIVVEGPKAGRLAAVAAIAGGASAAAALASPACPEAARLRLVVDHPGRDLPKAATLWSPASIGAGTLPAPEIDRALREFLGMAVPRPLPPRAHRVSVLRLPRAASEDSLLAAAFRSPWTTWITMGDAIFVATDDAVIAADLAASEAAEPLVTDVELGQLRLVGQALPSGSRVIGAGPGVQLALCPADCAVGASWLDRRFDREDGPPQRD